MSYVFTRRIYFTYLIRVITHSESPYHNTTAVIGPGSFGSIAAVEAGVRSVNNLDWFLICSDMIMKSTHSLTDEHPAPVTCPEAVTSFFVVINRFIFCDKLLLKSVLRFQTCQGRAVNKSKILFLIDW